MLARRQHLPAKPPADNPGLALARYLENLDDEHTAVKSLNKSVATFTANSAYQSAFTRWQSILQTNGCLHFTGTLASPLAIGLGNESSAEVGLTTHAIYGMPIIRGSALKGLCLRGARKMVGQGKLSEEQCKAIFGTTAEAAGFIFWDAWYIPKERETPFHCDTITVHHPDYYGKRGEGAWPTDFDDPNPIPFLVVKPKTQFLFAVDGRDEDWRKWGIDFLPQLMQWSMTHLGVGGKTNAGYGYFDERWIYPPREEVWENCHIERRPVRRGGVEIQIRQGEYSKTFNQSEWDRTGFEKPWSSAIRTRFNANKLFANVLVLIDGEKKTVIQIIPLP